MHDREGRHHVRKSEPPLVTRRGENAGSVVGGYTVGMGGGEVAKRGATGVGAGVSGLVVGRAGGSSGGPVGDRNNIGVVRRWNASTGSGLVRTSAILFVLGIWAKRTMRAAIASRTRW